MLHSFTYVKLVIFVLKDISRHKFFILNLVNADCYIINQEIQEIRSGIIIEKPAAVCGFHHHGVPSLQFSGQNHLSSEITKVHET
jgi:hypothetical protein